MAVQNRLNTEQVAELAKNLHQTQKLKSGKNYYGHVLRVSEYVEPLFWKLWPRVDGVVTQNMLDAFEMVKQTAYLHDALEDCCDEGILERLGVDPIVIQAVKLLTKPKNFDPANYGAYLKQIKYNWIARIVKMADLEHNSKLSRIPLLNEVESLEKVKARHQKYLMSYIYLSGNYGKEDFSG